MRKVKALWPSSKKAQKEGLNLWMGGRQENGRKECINYERAQSVNDHNERANSATERMSSDWRTQQRSTRYPGTQRMNDHREWTSEQIRWNYGSVQNSFKKHAGNIFPKPLVFAKFTHTHTYTHTHTHTLSLSLSLSRIQIIYVLSINESIHQLFVRK